MPDRPTYTDAMNRLIEQFTKLPGIGRRTAERLAFHVLKTPADQALPLARAIEEVKTNVRHCSVCYNLTEHDPCSICDHPDRDRHKVLVVEQPRDVLALEQTRMFDGVYHVLLGHISPLEGVGPGDLTIDALVERVKAVTDQGEKVEVILGTNPNLEGDGTGLYVAQRLEGLAGVTLSRLARGLPAGSQLEYANKSVLSDAIASRQAIK